MNGSVPEYPFRGGSYETVHKPIRGRHDVPGGVVIECHHVIPQQSLKACGLDPAKGPSIQMVRSEHRETGTFGMDEDAVELRQQITERLTAGDLDGAYALGAHDVRSGDFGPKYDHALQEADRYYREEYRLPALQQLWQRERVRTQGPSVDQTRRLR